MKLGPRVLGDEEWQRQQRADEEAKERAYKYGPRVAGPEPASDDKTQPAASKSAATKQKKEKKQEPLAELEEKLSGELSEGLLDELVAAEFERSDGGPRKGALKLLLKAEQSRGDAARGAVIAELQGALKG